MPRRLHEVREAAGRVMMVGLSGTALTDVERAWLRLIRPTGIILFRRNIETIPQTVALLREATRIIDRPTLRCVDMEGGMVDRLRDVLTPMPSPARVFATRDPQMFYRHGKLIGKAAHMAGFNATLAPVVDLALANSAGVMKTRVVSAVPHEVRQYALTFLEGLETEEVFGCAKHFPGLGGGMVDSHLTMPVIDRKWADLWNEDLAPFRSLARRVPITMVAHAAYPLVTKNHTPASLSPYWIQKILRRRIGFRGLVLSDDMEMGGVLSHCPIGEAVIHAISAGTDVVEICHNPALILTAYEALLREAEQRIAFRRQLTGAARRVDAWTRRWSLIQTLTLRSPTVAQIDKLRGQMAAFTRECT